MSTLFDRVKLTSLAVITSVLNVVIGALNIAVEHYDMGGLHMCVAFWAAAYADDCKEDEE